MQKILFKKYSIIREKKREREEREGDRGGSKEENKIQISFKLISSKIFVFTAKISLHVSHDIKISKIRVQKILSKVISSLCLYFYISFLLGCEMMETLSTFSSDFHGDSSILGNVLARETRELASERER